MFPTSILQLCVLGTELPANFVRSAQPSSLAEVTRMLPLILIVSSALQKLWSFENPCLRLATELLFVHDVLLLHGVFGNLSHFPSFRSNSFVGELSFL